MKKDIILAGVGGQGILSVAAVIGMAALENNLFVKQAEVHGMSQRGGAVMSHLRISSEEIYSDLIQIGGADIILSVEPMESLRYLEYLSPDGWLITNTKPFVNVPDYPDLEKLLKEINSLPRSVAFDANEIALQLKAPKASNIVMVGAASPYLDIPYEKVEEGIRKLFGRKGEEVVETNLRALKAGKEKSIDSFE
jgi:indolepyruvate ferredoxin oxidoreductase beta subunit